MLERMASSHAMPHGLNGCSQFCGLSGPELLKQNSRGAGSGLSRGSGSGLSGGVGSDLSGGAESGLYRGVGSGLSGGAVLGLWIRYK